MTGSNAASAERWWQSAVIYQIYPRSFCDASGDGIGDLEGVRRHLDYLSWLGIDAVWLSPFYPSPMADFGYDVADYCGVDPLFGTLDDLDRLIDEAHARSIKVILDWVPNHTSDQHPWFLSSRSSREDPKRDWYWWHDGRRDEDGGHGPPGSPGRLPNNWRAAFPGVGRSEFPPAWTWDAKTQQWYLHLFLDEQPDLNWSNEQVRAAMGDVVRFWLDRGADGFRIDVVHALGKDSRFPDLPEELAGIPICALIDEPSTHPVLVWLRRLVEEWHHPERVLIGETVLPTLEQIPAFFGTPEAPELHLAFNFRPLRTSWKPDRWRLRIEEAETVTGGPGHWPTWVLSNHDNPRHRSRYGTEARARVAAVMLLTLRGTPFLYAGEEIGQEDAVVPPTRQVDPGGRDGCRAPIPWDASSGHGWAGGEAAWLPWPPGATDGHTVAEQQADPYSMLNLYRRLIAARRQSEALKNGALMWLESADKTLAYRRSSGNDERVIALNFSSEPSWMRLPAGSWTVEVAARPDDVELGENPVLALAPDQALVLRPS